MTSCQLMQLLQLVVGLRRSAARTPINNATASPLGQRTVSRTDGFL